MVWLELAFAETYRARNFRAFNPWLISNSDSEECAIYLWYYHSRVAKSSSDVLGKRLSRKGRCMFGISLVVSGSSRDVNVSSFAFGYYYLCKAGAWLVYLNYI